MAKTIWKYTFETTDAFSLEMPRNASVLTVEVQHGQPRLWALVDDLEPKVQRHFRVYGTGHDVDAEGHYLGSYQLHHGALVFHVFEV